MYFIKKNLWAPYGSLGLGPCMEVEWEQNENKTGAE